MAVKSGSSRAKGNFHESYSPSVEVQPPSARSTGFVFTAVAVLIGIGLRDSTIGVVIAGLAAVTLLALSFLAPQLLQPLNIIWFKFGMLLHKVVNPVVMFLMFALAFLPMGMLMRVFADPLRLKRKDGLTTYWLEPDPAELKLRSMKNQF